MSGGPDWERAASPGTMTNPIARPKLKKRDGVHLRNLPTFTAFTTSCILRPLVCALSEKAALHSSASPILNS